MATMLPGVRPSMAWASAPTFSSLPVFLSMATTDGSFNTTPLPFTYTSTEAVPRSMPISFAMEHILLHLYLVFRFGRVRPLLSDLSIIPIEKEYCNCEMKIAVFSVFYTETPKSIPQLSRAMASVRQTTSAAPAAFSTRTHSVSVAPVVMMSSMSRKRFPAMASGSTGS